MPDLPIDNAAWLYIIFTSSFRNGLPILKMEILIQTPDGEIRKWFLVTRKFVTEWQQNRNQYKGVIFCGKYCTSWFGWETFWHPDRVESQNEGNGCPKLKYPDVTSYCHDRPRLILFQSERNKPDSPSTTWVYQLHAIANAEERILGYLSESEFPVARFKCDKNTPRKCKGKVCIYIGLDLGKCHRGLRSL